jgi:hypothetical protein
MNNTYVCARRILTVVALAFVAQTIWARPVLVAPQRLNVPRLVEPDSPVQFHTIYSQPAIDGDTLIVGAERAIDADGGRRNDIFLFERNAGGTWTYVRPLVEGAGGSVVLNGNLAVVHTFAALLVFERGAQGWTQTDSLETETGEWNASDTVFRIDSGSLYVRRDAWAFPPLECQPPFQQWSQVNGTWTAVATIGGERCGDHRVDVNDGRALLVDRPEDPAQLQGPAFIHAQTGAASWPRVAELTPPPPDPRGYVNWFGYSASLSGNSAYIDYGWLFRNNGADAWVSAGKLHEPETELQISSNQGRLRGDTLVLLGAEPDYEFRTRDWELSHEFHTLRAYRKLANGFFDYYAKLGADFDIWWWALSEDGRRVAAVGNEDVNGQSPATRLYVFEIPDVVSFHGTQQDTFETNNHARWTPTFGQFAVATRGATRVLRQSSLSGDAQAHLTAIDWADQSIEADMRPLEFAGTDRWFGLVTRRVDAGNYYYATFRAPSTISLRRMHDGVITELGRAFLRGGFTPGRNYRLRLESVGDQHVVFVDGLPRVRAKDSVHAHGHPGVASYRTRFEVDNVVVSSGTRVAARLDTWERNWSGEYYWLVNGTWSFTGEPDGDVNGDGESDIFVLRQADTAGDVKWFSKIALGNHVVSARVRPMSFGATTATQDAWVGLAAQVKDERNYYYVTLRDSNQISLRRMVNGTVQVLATVSQPMITGTWYDLRLEIVNTSIRVHVNGDLRIQLNDSTLSGGGRNGMLMYKTAADWESYVAYQP